MAAFVPMSTATAQLSAVGPVSPDNGFPTYYTDGQGTQLDLCLTNPDLCTLPAAVELLNPALPFPLNYGGTFQNEAFYWLGTADMTSANNGRALLVMAMQAAFLNGPVVPGEQVTFGRFRIRVDNLVAGATYRITTPYGTFTQVSTGGRRSINFTQDIGLIPGDFVTPLNAGIGPFLRWDSELPIFDLAGNEYLGNPLIPHTVTGSPTGNNVFRIDGPNVGGPGINTISTNLFSIVGKIGVPPPAAAFTVAPATGAAPLTVAFADASTGSINAWSWDFGDGSTSLATNPTHVYSNPGSYTVSLTVSGPGGSTTATQIGAVVVNAVQAAPVANFTAAPVTGTAPLSVTFADASTGATAWSWSFGDGATSTLQNPVHVYAAAGSYTVSLTATGPGGSNTAVRAGLVTVEGAPPAINPTLAAPVPGTGGVVNTFTITGCTPGATVTVLIATTTGTSTITIGGVRVRTGLRTPSVLGSGTAAADGTVSLQIAVSANLRGRTRVLQAYDAGSGLLSNRVTERF